MKWNDPRAVFAYLYLVVVGILALAIAIGTVKPDSSFGLEPLIVLLAGMGPAVMKGLSDAINDSKKEQ